MDDRETFRHEPDHPLAKHFVCEMCEKWFPIDEIERVPIYNEQCIDVQKKSIPMCCRCYEITQ